MDADIPYLLLTPGPLSTSRTVREAMGTDYSTWDVDYNERVQRVRRRLVALVVGRDVPLNDYTSVLMQGSGTFAVEATVGSVVPRDGKLLVVDNGAYGARIATIAQRLGIDHTVVKQSETEPADLHQLDAALKNDSAITHVAIVHCETTTGLLNPVEEAGAIVRRHGRTYIVDAMSSFAGVPITMLQLQADYLIASSNKCVQGTPGFGFVIARRAELEATQGFARSLALDLYDQWHEMETKGGKWRFTSPTHVVCAFDRALDELDDEGGVAARHERYANNQRLLADGMTSLGFRLLIDPAHQSPIITSFQYPDDAGFDFQTLYDKMKSRRYVIYPGKVSVAPCFRIGTIGHVFAEDITDLVQQVGEVIEEMGVTLRGTVPV